MLGGKCAVAGTSDIHARRKFFSARCAGGGNRTLPVVPKAGGVSNSTQHITRGAGLGLCMVCGSKSFSSSLRAHHVNLGEAGFTSSADRPVNVFLLIETSGISSRLQRPRLGCSSPYDSNYKSTPAFPGDAPGVSARRLTVAFSPSLRPRTAAQARVHGTFRRIRWCT